MAVAISARLVFAQSARVEFGKGSFVPVISKGDGPLVAGDLAAMAQPIWGWYLLVSFGIALRSAEYVRSFCAVIFEGLRLVRGVWWRLGIWPGGIIIQVFGYE